ncbi:MAG: hypothetical protein F4Y06_08605 [Rhodospirillales bacterium]|nr:hypothetical protein [Rhodospirillales bacterium]
MPGSRNLPGALDRDTLRQLFEELADELARARVRACICIIGGAAMTMAHRRDRATHGVDARTTANRPCSRRSERSQSATDCRLPG